MRQPLRRTENKKQIDESLLFQLLKEGDSVAVRQFVQDNNRRLFRVARAVLRDESEAEDVVQETYIRAFANLASFRGESSLLSWLTRIALNEAYGRLRRRKRPTTGIEAIEQASESGGAELILFPNSPPNPELEFGRQQVRLVLERFIDELPEPFRLVFILREIEELSIEQTANILSLAPATVKTRLHRARRQLRKALTSKLAAGFTDLFPFGGAKCSRLTERVLRTTFIGRR